MKKMVKCRSCGADIAKTAKRCPNCGARQHIGSYVACAIIIVVTFIACITILGGSGGDPASASKSSVNEAGGEKVDTITFSGSTYSAEYSKCWEASGVNGCFYITVKISNTGDTECTYLLDDVYVDGTHCQSGSGLPVTALPGKNVNGSFVIFCETPLKDISNIEFCLKVMDSNDSRTIETSDTITVTPND